MDAHVLASLTCADSIEFGKDEMELPFNLAPVVVTFEYKEHGSFAGVDGGRAFPALSMSQQSESESYPHDRGFFPDLPLGGRGGGFFRGGLCVIGSQR
jgi:hypothetical protein